MVTGGAGPRGQLHLRTTYRSGGRQWRGRWLGMRGLAL